MKTRDGVTVVNQMLSVLTGFLLLLPAAGAAQGVTSAGLQGVITAGFSRSVEAHVRINHSATGHSAEARTSAGRFLIQGLEPGGPYTIVVRSLGFVAQRRDGIYLALGELKQISFVLEPVATQLDTVTVAARADIAGAPGLPSGGTGMTITASILERVPTLNRDLYDFVRLVPQVSTKISLPNPGLSAGGVGFRFNNFLINGVSDRTVSGSVSTAFAGAKSIPIDAVKEYQVLLSPYDVRYGDFAGALINAVTKSGTNQLRGSVFAYGRNDALARRDDEARAPYERAQYGFSLGGPIIRNRLHFFIAPELQHFTYPAAGPYSGQPLDALQPVPVSEADLERVDSILRNYGLSAGSAGPVENESPLRNLFARLDLTLPVLNTRVAAWSNYSGSDEIAFSRAARDTFPLTSYGVTRVSRGTTNAVHAHTTLSRAGGGHNELLASMRFESLVSRGAVDQPTVRVSVPSVSGGGVTLVTGTHETAQSSGFRSSTFAVKNHLTLPFGTTHVVTIGGEIERFGLRRGGGSYGMWSFASLDNLEHGVADRYDTRIDLGSAVPISGIQYALSAGDQWKPGERLTMTAGIRADLFTLDDRAPYHPLVDFIFGRRTDELPRRRVELSPRIGFAWDPHGTQRSFVRGGLGIFTGRFPIAWAHTALTSHGIGGTLRCNRLSPVMQPPPLFSPDHRAAPTSCAGGATITAASPGDVDLLDRNLRVMRVVRGSLAYDRPLPRGIVFTNEVLLTRALSDFVAANLNLADPQSVDTHGRVMYGSFGPSGAASPNRKSPFAEVIELRNTARNRSLQVSTRLEKTHAAGTSGSVSYTFSRSRDVQTLLRVNARGTALWASARATAGRHDDLSTGISSNDIPHRIIVAGTLVAPWSRSRTEMSFYYVGESGRPFTFTATGTLGRGDLNADGSNANDPIYVPLDARDPLEIHLSGVSDSAGADNSPAAQAHRTALQQAAFESFVERTACLRRQRGEILERNSCREPWSNTTIASIRQEFALAGRAVDARLEIFNVLNLLSADWGHRRESAPAILEHVGQTGTQQPSRPMFRFNTRESGLTVPHVESAFQLQLALRYRF